MASLSSSKLQTHTSRLTALFCTSPPWRPRVCQNQQVQMNSLLSLQVHSPLCPGAPPLARPLHPAVQANSLGLLPAFSFSHALTSNQLPRPVNSASTMALEIVCSATFLVPSLIISHWTTVSIISFLQSISHMAAPISKNANLTTLAPCRESSPWAHSRGDRMKGHSAASLVSPSGSAHLRFLGAPLSFSPVPQVPSWLQRPPADVYSRFNSVVTSLKGRPLQTHFLSGHLGVPLALGHSLNTCCLSDQH